MLLDELTDRVECGMGDNVRANAKYLKAAATALNSREFYELRHSGNTPACEPVTRFKLYVSKDCSIERLVWHPQETPCEYDSHLL